MEQEDLSPKAIYEATQINERLIRAWRTGERLPSLDMIPALAQGLHRPPEELEKPLIESLKLKRTKRKDGTSQQRNFEYLHVMDVDRSIQSSTPTISLPKNKLVKGKSNLNQAMIAMVQSIGKAPNNENNKILITFQNKEVVFEDEYRNSWHESLRQAIKNGWFIEHIIQVNRSSTRLLMTTSNVLRFISDKDQYKLYKSKHRKPIDVSTGMLIVPGMSAMICFAADQSEFVDTGVFYQAPDENELIKAYQKHFEQYQQQSELVCRKFENYQQQEVLEAFVKSDEQAGDRIVILKRISEVTRPSNFYKIGSNWSKAIREYYNFSDEELKQHLEIRQRRHEQFRNMLKTNYCRYIYYAKNLREFVETGNTYPYYFHATEQERLEQLLEIKRLILSPESHNHFELAIIQEEEEDIIGDIKPSFCEVKGGVIIIMEIPTGAKDKKGHLHHKWFVIKDSAITSAFQDYFSDVWDRLKDDCKGLAALIWLNQQINTLEDKLGLPRSL